MCHISVCVCAHDTSDNYCVTHEQHKAQKMGLARGSVICKRSLEPVLAQRRKSRALTTHIRHTSRVGIGCHANENVQLHASNKSPRLPRFHL